MDVAVTAKEIRRTQNFLIGPDSGVMWRGFAVRLGDIFQRGRKLGNLCGSHVLV